MSLSYRHTASFGKRIEYYIIGLMLKEGLDCYLPMVDDDGIDCVIRKNDGTFIEIQIKARSKDVGLGDAALFAALRHDARKNYFFVFYSERLENTWIMSSEEFLKECSTNKNGKHIGTRSIWFNDTKTVAGKKTEYPKDKYKKYEVTNFDRFK